MFNSLRPMGCSQPGSVQRILQARILEWVAIPFSWGSSQPRDQIRVSCITGGFFTTEPPGKPYTYTCMHILMYVYTHVHINDYMYTYAHLHVCIQLYRRRQWHPTPVLLPGKSHGWRSLVGCSSWGLEESDTTKRLYFHFSYSCIGEGNGNPLQCSCLENPRDRGAWWAAVSGVAQSRTRLK